MTDARAEDVKGLVEQARRLGEWHQDDMGALLLQLADALERLYAPQGIGREEIARAIKLALINFLATGRDRESDERYYDAADAILALLPASDSALREENERMRKALTFIASFSNKTLIAPSFGVDYDKGHQTGSHAAFGDVAIIAHTALSASPSPVGEPALSGLHGTQARSRCQGKAASNPTISCPDAKRHALGNRKCAGIGMGYGQPDYTLRVHVWAGCARVPVATAPAHHEQFSA